MPLSFHLPPNDRGLAPAFQGLAAGFVGLITVALASCAVGPDYHTPRVPVPDHYAAVPQAAAPPVAGGATKMASSAPSPVSLATWWRALEDPELDSLVERAVAQNPNVLIALDRLQAARTYEVGLIGTLLPTAGASVAWGAGTAHDESSARAAEPLTAADNTHGLSSITTVGGFDAVWQIDVFGKIRREIEQARYDAEAAADARSAVLVSVVADVVGAYVDLRGLQVRESVLRAAADVLNQNLHIMTERYNRGITNELDVALAQREYSTIESQIPTVVAQVHAGEYAIATLLGQYPEDLEKELVRTGMIPAVPSVVQTGLPLDLLRRRPDIAEAEREIASANAGIGIATADLFPQFIATGAMGFQEGKIGAQRVPEHIWSAGPGAEWPLLDFGQLDAQVQIANLQTRAMLVNYKALIQTAVEQVDAAVDSLSAAQASLKSMNEALVASQRAVTLASERYDRGVTDYLNVVDAERQEYAIEEQYVATQASVDDQFVALYRDLGGGWQGFQKVPGIVRPLPAVIAIFRDTIARADPLKDP